MFYTFYVGDMKYISLLNIFKLMQSFNPFSFCYIYVHLVVLVKNYKIFHLNSQNFDLLLLKLLQPLWKSVWKFLKILKLEISFDPAVILLGTVSKELKTAYHSDMYTPMITAVQFTTAKLWIPRRCHQQMDGL